MIDLGTEPLRLGAVALSPDLLRALLEASLSMWVSYGAVFLRVGTAMLVLPGVGEAAIPIRIRLMLGLALSVIIAPTVTPMPVEAPAWRLAAEPVTGLFFGLALRLLVLALNTAGAIIAQSTSLAQIFGGASGEPQPAVGHLLTMAGLAVAFASGLHLALVEALIVSYQAIGQGALPGPADLRSWGVAEIARSFRLAFTLSLPFVLGSLLYNLALGVINKAMPQLMVSFIGAPALTLGGLALLAVALPVGVAIWTGEAMSALQNPFAVTP